MNESLEEFRYDDSCSAIYSFVYDKFCSWFIEVSKSTLNGEDLEAKTQRATVLKYCFRKIVALLHPITPFITEELWTYLKEDSEDLLIIQEYPEYDISLEFSKEQEDMNKFIEVITTIRNLRASVNIKPKEEVNVSLFTDNEDLLKYYQENAVNFLALARVKGLEVGKKSEQRPGKSIMSATTHTEVFLPLEGVINLEEQIARLQKDLAKAEKELEKFSKKLSNEKFVNSAPESVVAEVKEKAANFEEKVKSIKENISKFQ